MLFSAYIHRPLKDITLKYTEPLTTVAGMKKKKCVSEIMLVYFSKKNPPFKNVHHEKCETGNDSETQNIVKEFHAAFPPSFINTVCQR